MSCVIHLKFHVFKKVSFEPNSVAVEIFLHLRHRIFGALPILRIAGLEKIYPSEHFLNQSVKVLPKISGLRIWCPSMKFDHEMNWKGFLYLVLLR